MVFDWTPLSDMSDKHSTPQEPSHQKGEDTPKASASAPEDTSTGSTAGSGFETMLGRLVVDRGLVSDKELAEVASELLLLSRQKFIGP